MRWKCVACYALYCANSTILFILIGSKKIIKISFGVFIKTGVDPRGYLLYYNYVVFREGLVIEK